MARVVFTPTAAGHLRRLRAYIAQDSPDAARAMVQRIRADAARLGQFPEMGRIVPEYREPAIREVIVGPYRVVYRFRADRNVVQVIGVIHGSRVLPLPAD